MNQLIKVWIDMSLLRIGPQVLPSSSFLLGLTIVSYSCVNVILSAGRLGVHKAFALVVMDALVLCAFTWVMLGLVKHGARLLQTLTALFGTGTFFSAISIPLVLMLQSTEAGSAPQVLVPLLWLGLMAWSLLVFGHILRHALSVPLGAGVMLAFVFTLASIALLQTVFPEPS